MKCVLVSLYASVVVTCSGQLLCSEWLISQPLKYHPLRHCQRSNEYQIGARNVPSLEKCAQYAENNFALAFNYGHGRKPKNESADNNLINLFNTHSANRSTIDESEAAVYVNCEILACPEIGNLSMMVNDTRYDYYTLFANPIREQIRASIFESVFKRIFFRSSGQRNLLAIRWNVHFFV